MASNTDLTQTKAHHKDFILRKAGKFWILLSKDKPKRLTFLDNVKDVVIDDNILIADDKLFESFNDKEGKLSFRKLEDVSCESDNKWKEEVGEQKDDNPQKTEAEKIQDSMETFVDLTDSDSKWKEEVEGQNDENVHKTWANEAYDDSTANRRNSEYRVEEVDKDNVNKFIGLRHQTRGANTASDSSANNESDETDINLGSEEEVIYYNLDSTQEVCASLESSSTEENSDTTTTHMTENTLEEMCPKFDVEVESTDLAKLCGIKGRMRLLPRKHDLAFEDPITGRIIYCFKYPWVRRFGKNDLFLSFDLEVGRKCPYGEGHICCTTRQATRIHDHVWQKIVASYPVNKK